MPQEDVVFPDDHTIFTEDALRSQDGKEVPLTKYPGGPAIGKVKLKYNEAEKRLDIVETVITDETYLKMLSSPQAIPSRILKGE